MSHFFVHWLDLAAPLAIGGLWLWMFFTQLRQRPLLAVGDPYLRESLAERRRPSDGARTDARRTRIDPPTTSTCDTPPGAGHEHTDANVWIIVKFGLWLAISAVVIHVGMWAACSTCSSSSAKEPASRGIPLASGQEPRLPPEPRLQQFPANEIYEFRQRERTLLQRATAGSTAKAGVVHIPIEEAMRLTVERGLPSRAPAAGAAGAARPG